jgi:hypothetical protein
MLRLVYPGASPTHASYRGVRVFVGRERLSGIGQERVGAGEQYRGKDQAHTFLPKVDFLPDAAGRCRILNLLARGCLV